MDEGALTQEIQDELLDYTSQLRGNALNIRSILKTDSKVLDSIAETQDLGYGKTLQSNKRLDKLIRGSISFTTHLKMCGAAFLIYIIALLLIRIFPSKPLCNLHLMELRVPYKMPETKQNIQVKLRTAHFTLGKEDDRAQTMSQRQYPAFQSQAPTSHQTTALALRQSHFVLGTDKAIRHTGYLQDYPKFNSSQQAVLSKETMADLRSTHYKLGSGYSNYTSVAKADYGPKNVGVKPLKERQVDAALLREHNFQMGIDKSGFVTQSGATFVGYKPQHIQSNVNENIKELRGTHFKLGNGGTHYDTSNKRDYISTSGLTCPKVDYHLQGSHFGLGDNQNKQDYFRTTHMANFPNFGPTKGAQTHDPNKEANLRAAHFNLGKSDRGNVSEAKSQFVPTRGDKVSEQFGDTIRKSSVKFGSDNGEYRTIYMQNHPTYKYDVQS